MVIRGPRPEQLPASVAGIPPATKPTPGSPVGRLLEFGTVKTPVEAQKLLASLLQNMRANGFPVGAVPGSEAQLRTALTAFQQREGLPTTGTLDRATLQKLVDKGLVPNGGDDSAAPTERGVGGGVGNGRLEGDNRFQAAEPKRSFALSLPGRRLGNVDGGTGAPVDAKKGLTVETEQARARTDLSKPAVALDLRGLLTSMRGQGFGGAGKGAEQMKDAIQKLQRSENIPVTGTITAATAEAMQRRGLIDEQTARVLQQVDPTYAPPASSSAATDANRVSSPNAQHDAVDMGSPQSSADAHAGRGDDGGGAGGKGDIGGGGSSTAKNSDAVVGTTDHGDPAGDSAFVGNAPAGDDDDDDDRRGHANDMAREEMDEGSWRCASLSEQVERMMNTAHRDVDAGLGAVTYTWDVTLLRPGIYGVNQPAPELFHLAVRGASAFDTVWLEAREAINAKLRAFEPSAQPVDHEDIVAMLRRARYATAETSA